MANANPNARLTLLAFPQWWDGAAIGLRVLALPKGNPREPLVPGAPAFADASLVLDAVIVSGLDSMPAPGVETARVALNLQQPLQRAALFSEMASRFNIKATSAGQVLRPPKTRILKYLTPSYRNAFGFDGPRTEFAVTDQSYACALKDVHRKDRPPRPPATGELTWGQIIAFAIKNPLVAENLGLLYTELTVPGAGRFDAGGWLYVTLGVSSDFVSDVNADPSLLNVYAARIPPLDEPRALFAAVLFPVLAAPPGTYDDLFTEAESYDDGFAKIVHGAQPRTMGITDLDVTEPLPVKDVGIRLGWDDEQVAMWLNRRISDLTVEDTMLGVNGYRVDVRRAGTTNWHSMVRVRGLIEVGDITLGFFDGEMAIQTAPIQLHGEKTGDFWLPTYFTSWTGRSLIIRDRAAFLVSGQTEIAEDVRMQPVNDTAVPLRYGEDYEFRVRLKDLSGGGPDSGRRARNPAPAPVIRVPFRRFLPPKQVTVKLEESRILIGRPPIGYPDLVFTGFDEPVAALLEDTPNALAEKRETGVPDPDVVAVQIAVEARALDGDDRTVNDRAPYVRLYTTIRHFVPGAPLNADLAVQFEFKDVADISELQPANPVEAKPGTGPLTLPTARDLRLRIRAVGKPDPEIKYFGSEAARIAQLDVSVPLRAPAKDERSLFVPQPAGEQIRAIYIQPEPAPSSQLQVQMDMEGRRSEVPADIAQRLAQELELNVVGLTFSGKSGRRTVFGCSSALAHTLTSARAAITFGSKEDLTRQWIIAIRVQLARDWTWDGIATRGFEIVRQTGEVVGTVELPRSLSREALERADRSTTEMLFFDAIEGKPPAGSHPAEITTEYAIRPVFWLPTPVSDPPFTWPLRLPVTTPPRQTPRLVSAGVALSPYHAAADYSSTEPRARRLWLEFEAEPDDPADEYFVRVLGYAPDPLLLHPDEVVPDPDEPPLPISPELIRVIRPGQPADLSGFDAMQPLIPAKPHRPDERVRHYLVPLPPGIDEASPRLFGFFIYEIRLAHDASRWSTAQARFGPALRVTGVQHPAPPLECAVMRVPPHVEVSAPLATPVLNGRNLRPKQPRTEVWALLYAQVTQMDGASRRNVLIGRARADPDIHRGDERHGEHRIMHALTRFPQDTIVSTLASFGLPLNSPLSVLAVELYRSAMESSDPLGGDLGQVRVLRTSQLVRVPAVCIRP